MIFEPSVPDDRRDTGPPESQALQDFDIRPCSSPKWADGKPACLVQSSEIVDKSQDLDARDRLPALGHCGIVLAGKPILRRWTGCSDLWPSLANKSVYSMVVGLVRKHSDGENDRTCRSRSIEE